MLEVKGMEEEKKIKGEEGIYKTIKDLTEEVIKYSQKIHNFPNEVKIVSAKLLLGPDGWGGNVYYLQLRYVVDGIECEVMRSIWANLTSIVNDVLFSIKDSYERTHFIQ
jgi:hypothetical protein